MAFTSTQAEIVGAILEFVIFGAYIMVFKDHMKILYRKRSMSGPYIYFLSSSLTLFILSLVHTSVDAWRTYTAFAGNLYTVPLITPDEFFFHQDTWDSITRTVCYDLITLVSDLFFVYRTWVVWNRSYVIAIVPFLLFLSDIAMTIYVIWSLVNTTDNSVFQLLLVANTSRYFFSVTLALTVLCTVLIAYRLWAADKHVLPLLTNVSKRHRQISKVSRIVIESAALYSSLIIIMLATDIVGNQVFFILLTAFPPIVGLIFSSIIVRSTTQINSTMEISRNDVSTLRFQSRLHNLSESGYTGTNTTATSAQDGVQIRLETIVDVNSNDDLSKIM